MAWIFHSLCGSNTTLSSIELKKKEKKFIKYHLSCDYANKSEKAQNSSEMNRWRCNVEVNTGIHVQLVEHEMRQIHKVAAIFY